MHRMKLDIFLLDRLKLFVYYNIYISFFKKVHTGSVEING